LMLVDFDRFGLGDPELEVATFVAEADFESSCYSSAAGEAFRAGFEAKWPLNAKLFNAYRVHKHIAKALRTATALRLDARERALEIISGAERLL
jgi:aminoglycoside phosphotransferase (APT) family kinase protein